jgi:hypothetical protein
MTLSLTDTEAVITSVEKDPQNFPLVNLEWGGPSDREPQDFVLENLGAVHAYGRDLLSARRAWVVLLGRCRLSVGQTIPVKPHPAP